LSDGENPTPVLLLPADAGPRDAGTATPFWRRDDWPAIVAALLLHILVIAAFLVDWRLPPRPTLPESIPVQIVFAPPKAPAAPPAPQPKPQTPFYQRESGKDERTTAPPSAETADKTPTRAPDAAAAAPPEPIKPQAALPSAPPDKPAPSHDAKTKAHDALAHVDPRKETDRTRAPHAAPPELLHIEPGDTRQSGDPYLNQIYRMIESHRTYPNVMGHYGVPVEGTVAYEFALDRAGHLIKIKVMTSSGTAALDEAGAAMIRDAAPFPSLPADYPGGAMSFIITLPLYPKPPW
jgi:protein TonB